jgi:hypothetical protein
MRFHGLMLLRDEIDIIKQNLDHLLSWIDSLYILDMGSVDGTWDVVQDYAKRDPRVVPFFSRPIVYDDCLRCMLFDQYRDRFEAGDWVMKIDADEFYHITPRRFVDERLNPMETAVLLQWYFFRLTQQEVSDYESGKVNVKEDRARPIEERRRYYKISAYSEPRMFRYRRTMRWPQTASFPFNAGFTAKERIPIRHYPHRDPEQMENRFRLRAAMMKLKAHAGGHWKLEDWRMELVDSSGASEAASSNVGLGVAPSITDGPLLHWPPGSPLVEQPLQNHLPAAHVRLAQRLIHPLLLPMLDSRRASYDRSYSPTPIPPEIAAHIYD